MLLYESKTHKHKVIPYACIIFTFRDDFIPGQDFDLFIQVSHRLKIEIKVFFLKQNSLICKYKRKLFSYFKLTYLCNGLQFHSFSNMSDSEFFGAQMAMEQNADNIYPAFWNTLQIPQP